MWLGIAAVLGLLGLALSAPAPAKHEENIEFRMPDVQPKKADTYLCLPMKMDKARYLTGFVPHANMSTAHHILLYGCEEPGERNQVWNCGEMSSPDSTFKQKPVCATGSKIVYAWAMDAPPLSLPKDVAFKVGDDSDIPWLVLQVHYKDVHRFIAPNNDKDNSGLTLKTTDQPQKRRAGVYLMGTGGVIPAKSTVYMEAACSYNEKIVMHPFAYRVHAHKHGQVVAGYRVRDDKWTEIGRMSPQKPQMFYNVSNPGIDVRRGDVLAARCTMVNNDDKDVEIGSTQQDEMCNFYIMYWVDGNVIPSENLCFTDGPPTWNWSDFFGLDLKAFPSTASIIPGTDKVIEASKQIMQKVEDELAGGQAALMEKYINLMNKFGLSPNSDEEMPYDPDEAYAMPQSYQGEEDEVENPFLEQDNSLAQIPYDLERQYQGGPQGGLPDNQVY